MGTCHETICKHRILFPSIQHLAWLPQRRPQGKQKCGLQYVKTAIFCTCSLDYWETVADRWVGTSIFYISKTFEDSLVSTDCNRIVTLISVLFAVYKFPLCKYICIYQVICEYWNFWYLCRPDPQFCIHICKITLSLFSRRAHNNELNKCIGDDTKAAARQSPNCIKKQKIK